MNQKISLAVVSFLFLFLFGASVQADKTDRLIRKANRYFEALPQTMPGSENDTPARIELGKQLYFDTRLSINDTQSCASCHPLGDGRGGMDNLPTSPGARGELGDRNTPTVLNAGWQSSQFWDGRAADLADQAREPILNPIEMGMPDEESVVKKLGAIPEYIEAFAKAFPEHASPLSYANLTEAIAAFERTLRSESRFDDFMGGEKTALTTQEQSGLNSFIRHNCIRCHDGPVLGGTLIEKLGVYEDYHNTEDQGRYRVTGDDEDRMMFKVASLRNVAVTGPWFHDGSGKSLEEVIRIMGRIQLEIELKDDEIADIAAFLGALTGKSLESGYSGE
ncbi:MAG: cytochrome-c peroxidase [gamma proteobacterium symbiont of Ctena orbiculata]|nr:cytochrome-c peroxidase [Candidatus Thiodiazotropha taylori]PUB88443.1 MAG: cytochrome-c peroxidase [gamma proteobacterium symbiont of Ctena orbiculata]PVV15523.1 MAG: cytochrome-c peroxidase [gamma proteobacterium symbiont of Ctena orbiculata]PVV15837.1 MAG: cytochrome-c peroxidase [gamma proteobacterium symbiont of Ctena orbiculata]PVV24926.1 MAG: cytochrome-c peroxidase [gamma proteobacterium symbiont of Ctena orbiculata]